MEKESKNCPAAGILVGRHRDVRKKRGTAERLITSGDHELRKDELTASKAVDGGKKI